MQWSKEYVFKTFGTLTILILCLATLMIGAVFAPKYLDYIIIGDLILGGIATFGLHIIKER